METMMSRKMIRAIAAIAPGAVQVETHVHAMGTPAYNANKEPVFYYAVVTPAPDDAYRTGVTRYSVTYEGEVVYFMHDEEMVVRSYREIMESEDEDAMERLAR